MTQNDWENLKYLVVKDQDANVLETLAGGPKSFSELKKETKIKHKSSLSRSIRRLSSRDLLTYEKPFYRASPDGRGMLELYNKAKKRAEKYDIEISLLEKN